MLIPLLLPLSPMLQNVNAMVFPPLPPLLEILSSLELLKLSPPLPPIAPPLIPKLSPLNALSSSLKLLLPLFLLLPLYFSPSHGASVPLKGPLHVEDLGVRRVQ